MAATKNHDYHLVEPSIWPLIGAIAAFALFGGFVLYLHDNPYGKFVMGLGVAGVLLTMYEWWSNTIREAHTGYHTPVVQLHLRYGMILFIASEVMFFVGWFWSWFDFALFPNALVSLHPDYLMLHTLWPREPGRTHVTCEWFFEPETIARDDFDSADAIGFWDMVNRQDWYVCELAQKGVATTGYPAGRYSAEEVDVHAFDSMVADRYWEALRSEVEVPA